MRLGELADASRVSQPTMSKLVQTLAGDDYIRRIADVEDSRAWLIATTPKGERALREWRDRLAQAAAPYFDSLTDDEARTLTAAAGIIEQRLAPAAELAA